LKVNYYTWLLCPFLCLRFPLPRCRASFVRCDEIHSHLLIAPCASRPPRSASFLLDIPIFTPFLLPNLAIASFSAPSLFGCERSSWDGRFDFPFRLGCSHLPLSMPPNRLLEVTPPESVYSYGSPCFLLLFISRHFSPSIITSCD